MARSDLPGAKGEYTKAGRYGRRAVPSSKRIIFTFRALGEPSKAACLSQRVHPGPSSSEDFVRIGLHDARG